LENATHMPYFGNSTMVSLTKKEYIAWITRAILLFFAPLIIFGNGLTIVVIIKYRRLRTYTNVFVASLAAADFLVGAVFIPLKGFRLLEDGDRFLMTKYYCLFTVGPYFCTLAVQMLSLLAISIDRFIAIVYPYNYLSFATRKIVAGIVIIIWIGPLIGTICFMTFWNR